MRLNHYTFSEIPNVFYIFPKFAHQINHFETAKRESSFQVPILSDPIYKYLVEIFILITGYITRLFRKNI